MQLFQLASDENSSVSLDFVFKGRHELQRCIVRIKDISSVKLLLLHR